MFDKIIYTASIANLSMKQSNYNLLVEKIK